MASDGSHYSRVLLRAQLTLLLLLPVAHSARCLQYSWLGTESMRSLAGTEIQGKGSDSFQLSNLTCKAFAKHKPMPCMPPFLIVTENYDGSTPDPKYIRGNLSSHDIECDPGEGNVCTMVTFLFGNNEVVNQTAYCARVTDDGASMKSGCVSARKGAYTNTVCVCDPTKSPTQFCIPNGAQIIAVHKMHILLIFFTTLFLMM